MGGRRSSRRAAEGLPESLANATNRALVTLLAAALGSSSPPADELAAATYSRLWPLIGGSDKLGHEESADLRAIVGAANGDMRRALVARIASAFRDFKAWRPEALLWVDNLQAFNDLLDFDARKGSRNRSLMYGLAMQLPIERMSRGQYDRLQATLARHAKEDDVLKLFEKVARRLIGF